MEQEQEQEQEQRTKKQQLIDHTLSVGLLHAAAADLLMRRAMLLHEQQGFRLTQESKRVFNDFRKAYERMQYCYDRLQEVAISKEVNPDTGTLFDSFVNDSSTLAMISMLYFNATNESNPRWKQSSDQLIAILRNLTLLDTDQIFPLEFINSLAPKISEK